MQHLIGPSVKVLLIEDNEHFRRLIRAVLLTLGVTEVEEAQDGVAALERLAFFSADLVICDWNMEPMDGVAFTQILRHADSPNRFLPIIMVTGYSEESLLAQARDVGVDEFLAKPITAQALINTVVSVIHHRRPFVAGGAYFGPDRRKKTQPWSGGVERRVTPPCSVMPDGQHTENESPHWEGAPKA